MKAWNDFMGILRGDRDHFDIVRDWIETFVWEITQAETIEDVDPNHFYVWDQLSPKEQGFAFHYLLGVFADTVGAAKEEDDT